MRALWLLVGMVLTGPMAQAEPPRLLMISVDGLRADYLTEADRYGLKIPTLRRLAREGVLARRMIGIFPSVTYPSHVTLITGQPPAGHGIVANERFLPLSDARADWYYHARDITCPTLVDAFVKAGRRTAGVAWPVTVGARLDDNFPEIWDAADFDGTFLMRSRKAATPGLLEAAERKYAFTMSLDSIDAHKNLLARFIITERKPDLLLLHYTEHDKQQHHHGPTTPEAFASLEATDRLIAETLEAYAEAGLADNLVIAIVSDHGFERVQHEFRPNALLRQAGLIDYDAETKSIRDWKVKAWVTGAAAAVMLKDPADRDSLEAARKLFERYTGRDDSPIGRILGPDEIERLGANPKAAFMFDAGPGWTFRGACGLVPFGPSRAKGMHGQLPDRPEMAAGLILSGKGIPAGRTVDVVQMVDVAPTLAGLCGVELVGTAGKPIALPAE